MLGYTNNAWKGSKYDSSLSMKDIAAIVRADLKKNYPDCKFSVTKTTYTGGASLTVSLMAAPFDPFATPDPVKVPGKDLTWGIDDAMNRWNRTVMKKHMDVNHYYIKDSYYMSDKAKEVFTYVTKLINGYNYDDSDAMVDYFDTNFYIHLSVGKWDKPFIKTN